MDPADSFELGVGNFVSNYNGTIGGGSANAVEDASGTIGGGFGNVVGFSSGCFSTVAGGHSNWARGGHSSVPGAAGNISYGDFGFAGGREAFVETGHHDTFIWVDFTGGSVLDSTGPDQFLVRANGGVGINTDSPNSSLHVSGDMQINITAGAPPAGDCDAASEEGRMKFALQM